MTIGTLAPSKSEQAYRHIRARIEDGRFSPGYRLVLDRLAGELDMSVVPVREAIRRLEAEGLVEYERNVGAQVALLDPVEYLHTMETLAVIEGYATAAAAPALVPEQLARAREINERLRRSLADFDPIAYTRLNLEFHAVLFEACPNPHILDLVHRGWERMSMLRESSFSFVPERAPDAVDEHDAILRLIEQGADAAEIERAAREHRLATLRAVLAHREQHAHRAPTPDHD
ncbi:MAG: GntR family transcriptional regulator [Micrococcales bacterium 73-13]|nr:MAG: GntR family transcriptional regulator [Micrococcales bacterium 73-13]